MPSQVLEKVALKHWHQPPDRVHRIANGVATMRYADKPDAKLIPQLQNRREGEVFIGCVAGLRPVKDLPLLVRAVAGVNARFKLVILGEGPERQNILDAAEAMAIEDQVILPGFLPEPHRYMPARSSDCTGTARIISGSSKTMFWRAICPMTVRTL